MIIILWKNSGMQKQHNRHSKLPARRWRQIYLHICMMELSKQCERCVWKNDDYNRFHFVYVLSPIVTFKDSLLNTFDAAFECLWLMAVRCRPFMCAPNGNKQLSTQYCERATEVTCKQIPYHTYSSPHI